MLTNRKEYDEKLEKNIRLFDRLHPKAENEKEKQLRRYNSSYVLQAPALIQLLRGGQARREPHI